MHNFGLHESISKGIVKAVYEAKDRECQALQIFQKPKIKYGFDAEFDHRNVAVLSAIEQTKVELIIHSGYVINLVSPREEVRSLSELSLAVELDKAQWLGAKYQVLHPGSVGKGGDRAEGYKLLGDALFRVLEEDRSVELLLETMPGAGGQLAGDLEEFAEFCTELWGQGLRFGIAFDTCHSTVAGYDFTSSEEAYNKFWLTWEEYFSEDRINLFHINGAFYNFGSNKDGHASLDGLSSANPKKTRETPSINPEFFKWLVQDVRFEQVTGILETPVHTIEQDLETIRSYTID